MNDCDGLPWHAPRRAEIEAGDADGRFRALELAIRADTPSIIKRTEWACVSGGGDVEGVTFGDEGACPAAPDADGDLAPWCDRTWFGPAWKEHVCTLAPGHAGPCRCECEGRGK